MTSELVVWTADDCASVLIDYQTEMVGVTELFRDWAGPLHEPALDVISWYFAEVPQHTDQVDVADAEKRAAAAREVH